MKEKLKINGDEIKIEYEEEVKIKRIDIFFDEMGYGKYQIRIFLMLVIILFTDSCQMLLINLILKNLKNEMNINQTEKSFLQSSVFIGLSIGTFFSGKYIDIYGRRRFIIYGGFILLFFSIISAFSLTCLQLIIFRIFLGIGIGIQMAAGINLASESIPKFNRSLYLTAVWIAFPLGEIFCSISAWFLMPNFEEGQWRKLILLCSIPMIISIYLSNQALESARYYYSNHYFEEGKEILKKIEEINSIENENFEVSFKIFNLIKYIFSFMNLDKNKDSTISVREYIRLKDEDFKVIEEETKNNSLNNYNSEWKELFNDRFKGITLRTWFLWISGTVILYQVVFMLPQILINNIDNNTDINKNKSNNNDYYIGLLTAAIIALPKPLIAGLFSEYFGRLKSMIISSILTIILCIVVLISDSNTAIICGLIKITSGMLGSIIKVYSSEIFPTKLREF